MVASDLRRVCAGTAWVLRAHHVYLFPTLCCAGSLKLATEGVLLRGNANATNLGLCFWGLLFLPVYQHTYGLQPLGTPSRDVSPRTELPSLLSFLQWHPCPCTLGMMCHCPHSCWRGFQECRHRMRREKGKRKGH